MKKWLVTYFEPFAGADSNSSHLVAQQLRTQKDWAGRVEFLPNVPVSFERAWPFVMAHLQASSESWAGVLALGQAEGNLKIHLERVGLNWVDASLADNDGVRPGQGPIVAGAPELLWSQIPWSDLPPTDPMLRRSYSAGTYVCNTLLFHSLMWAKQQGAVSGFVHIPALDVQTHQKFERVAKVPVAQAVESVARVLEFALSL
jgi:pyroglutamyl-peptidase